MKALFKVLLIGAVVFTCFPGSSQAQDVLDGIYVQEHTLERRVISYVYLREADVMWLKRTWRRIDLRQKINHVMYYPEDPVQGRKSLFAVISEAILNDGTITAYDPGPLGTDDMFTMRMTSEDARRALFSVDTSYTEDIESGELVPVVQEVKVESRDIKWYDIKEEWFFDRQRSVMEARIIGICPMKAKYDEISGEFRGLQPLFWIYYPEARYVFVKSEIFNRNNDVERRTYEDVFWKRQFGSYVIKESNVYDRSIAEYKTGLDALLEAEQIKDGIFELEHDLWSF